jgi:hypothetical protein
MCADRVPVDEAVGVVVGGVDAPLISSVGVGNVLNTVRNLHGRSRSC